MSCNILKTINITKIYNKKKVLNNISINIKKGDIYGFVGKNGAGKTTMIRIILGLSFSNEGKVEFSDNENIEKNYICRKNIGALIEKPILYNNMTAKENLEIIKIQRGIVDQNRVDEVLKLVNLYNANKKKVKHFSLGMKQRLGIAISLLIKPKLLILDEPLNGLDPIGIKEIRELLIRLNKEEKTTIFISSHILSELSLIVTRYGFIDKGVLIQEVSNQELDKICKIYIHVKVSDTSDIPKIFSNELNIVNYDIFSKNHIKIYEKISLDKFSLILAKYDISIYELLQKKESLEEYFSRLIGGNDSE
ncbi:MAG: ATP-binding cassette domain-containing protein [Sarcina sp.]